ncbi:MAG TPA: hypothetical protein DHU96_10350 [Actinobacteria bacterium]|nr:hypothetical protein [Actinomycetota bacterium]
MNDDDLGKLQQDYPGIRFGTVWASEGRVRRRRCWARRAADNALFTAPSVLALRDRLDAEPPDSPGIP